MDGIHPRDDHHLASLLEETRRLGHLVDDLHTLRSPRPVAWSSSRRPWRSGIWWTRW
jgi:hypothetical protein